MKNKTKNIYEIIMPVKNPKTVAQQYSKIGFIVEKENENYSINMKNNIKIKITKNENTKPYFSTEKTNQNKIKKINQNKIKEIIMIKENPADEQYYMQKILNQREMNSHSFGITIKCQNTTVNVLSPDGAKAFLKINKKIKQNNKAELIAVAVECPSIQNTKKILDKNKIQYYQYLNKIIIQQKITIILQNE